MPYGLFADAILLLHAALVVFITGGLGLVYFAALARRPRLLRAAGNRWFRGVHLGAMGVVLLEALLGLVCPLTRWEYDLRELAGQNPRYQGSFLQHWAERILYHHWEEHVFTLLYAAVFAAMLLALLVVPVRWRSAD